LTQFGNTCYSNSVVQALYYCKPFRDCVLAYQYPHSTIKLIVEQEKIDTTQLQGFKTQNEIPQILVKKNELDMPLEGAGSNVQVDSVSTQVADIWNGTKIDQLVQQYSINANSDNILCSIRNLFIAITNQKKQMGVIGPRQFITKLKQENGDFV
jgi:hypothetical protein